MIKISEHPEGCILPVRVRPAARKTAILGEHNGSLKVAITAPPDRGRANRALLEVLRETLGLKGSQIELLSGQTSREKRFLIRGLTMVELGARVEELLRIPST